MAAGGYGPKPYLCTCGKVVHGNLARASHRRACPDGRYYHDTVAYEMRAYAADLADAERAENLATDERLREVWQEVEDRRHAN